MERRTTQERWYITASIITEKEEEHKMPYVKKPDPPYVKMTRLLKGYGLNGTKLAEILGVSRPTAKARIDAPGKLTLGDLDRINRFGHIPIEELREAIQR